MNQDNRSETVDTLPVDDHRLENAYELTLEQDEMGALIGIVNAWLKWAESQRDEDECFEDLDLAEQHDKGEWALRKLYEPVAAAAVADMRRGPADKLLSDISSFQRAYQVSSQGGGGYIGGRHMKLEDIQNAAKFVDGDHSLEFMVFAGVADLLLEKDETLGEYLDRIRGTEVSA